MGQDSFQGGAGAGADAARDCVFIIVKREALFKHGREPSGGRRRRNARADELSIDWGLLPWQRAVTLGQQTNDFYTGDK